jgi:hypothetical protein
MECLCGYGRHCFVTMTMLSPMPEPLENDGRSCAYWRKRASDARARSAEMTDAAAEAKLQMIARMYDQMADHAAKREARKGSRGRRLRRG